MGVVGVAAYITVVWLALAVVTICLLALTKWQVRSSARTAHGQAPISAPSPAPTTPTAPWPAPANPRKPARAAYAGRQLSGIARTVTADFDR